jgi:flagellar protein FlgJ
MIDRIGSAPAAPVATDPRDAKLKQAAQNLEGLFVQQLFKAMRETVPEQEGIVSGGAGEEIFTELLDQHLAAETPKHWEGGLSDAIYRQMRRGLPAETSAPAPEPTIVTPVL